MTINIVFPEQVILDFVDTLAERFGAERMLFKTERDIHAFDEAIKIFSRLAFPGNVGFLSSEFYRRCFLEYPLKRGYGSQEFTNAVLKVGENDVAETIGHQEPKNSSQVSFALRPHY